MKSTSMSIEQIIERCARKDARAQKMLYEMFGPRLFAICHRYASSEQEAQDILQDGFIKIFEKIDLYKGEGSFEGWMRRIVVNTALDLLRKNKKLRYQVDIDAISYSLSSNDSVMSDLAAEELLRILQGIPVGYRTVFNLYAIEGYSHKEIAEQLEITISTSKSQFSRAKAVLRGIVEKMDLLYES